MPMVVSNAKARHWLMTREREREKDIPIEMGFIWVWIWERGTVSVGGN